jgi:hypothetical protein
MFNYALILVGSQLEFTYPAFAIFAENFADFAHGTGRTV